MKRATILIALLGILSCIAVSAIAQPKVRVAVLRFEDNTAHRWWVSTKLGEAAADVFVTALLNTGKFSVIERNRLDDILKEHNLVAQGGVTPQSAVELGKLLGAELMVLGSITEFGVESYGARFRGIGGNLANYHTKIDIRVVNVQTSEIIYAGREGSSYRGVGVGIKGFEAGRDADYGKVAGATMAGAVEKLAAGVAAKSAEMSTYLGFGRIARVSGDKVYINRGTQDGVQVGDRFEVWRMGEPIVDPDTGQTIGVDEEKIGVIEVTSVQPRLSICSIVEGNPGNGDMIKK